MSKKTIVLGVLEKDGIKVNGATNFVHEELQDSEIRVLRVDYIVRKIEEKEFVEPMVGRFVHYLKEALKKVKEIGDSAIIDEGMTRQAEALFMSVQPGFELSIRDRKKIRELCEANGVEIPKGD
jgi:hypothetical protein